MKANYENKTEEAQSASGNLNMNLYDLNKAAVRQLPSYTDADKLAAIELINNFDKQDWPHYLMLLGKDLNYYTVFAHLGSLENEADIVEDFGTVVIECLESLGDIKSIDYTETKDALEIWVVSSSDKEAHVLYLFNYDKGVVVCA